MIKKILQYALPITLFVGVICFAFATLFDGDSSMTVITEGEINYFGQYTWKYYWFDINKWLQSLETSIKIDQLAQALPDPPTLPTKPGNDILQWISFIAQLLTVYVTNWLIFVINVVLILPIKLLLYPVNIILAIIGINTSDNAFIQAFNYLYNLNIPLIKGW